MKKSLKTIYFVRHGESADNAARVCQRDETPLTERGLMQANALAKRLTHLTIDAALVSPLLRTRQTWEALNRVVKKTPEYDEVLREVRVPKEVIGKSEDDPETRAVMKDIRAHRHDPAWHFSDEENFADRKARAARIVARLESAKTEHILVVTHNGVIKSVGAYLLFGEDMTPQEYYRFLEFTNTKNTGITVCKQLIDRRWKLITWNDLGHLG